MAVRTKSSLLAVLGITVISCTRHEPVQRPQIALNPRPLEYYEVEVVAADDIVERVSGTIQYHIENRNQCVPVDHARALGGIVPSFVERFPISFSRRSSSTFVARVPSDKILSADYYGKGACHWAITGIGIDLNGNTDVSILYAGPEIIGEERIERLCQKPGHIVSGTSTFGCTGAKVVAQRGYPEQSFYQVQIQSRKE